MKNKTGGHAFPQIIEDDLGAPTRYVHFGMSLRDYFAAKAMQGLLGRDLDLEGDPDEGVLAEQAYEFADAMLKARQA